MEGRRPSKASACPFEFPPDLPHLFQLKQKDRLGSGCLLGLSQSRHSAGNERHVVDPPHRAEQSSGVSKHIKVAVPQRCWVASDPQAPVAKPAMKLDRRPASARAAPHIDSFDDASCEKLLPGLALDLHRPPELRVSWSALRCKTRIKSHVCAYFPQQRWTRRASHHGCSPASA